MRSFLSVLLVECLIAGSIAVPAGAQTVAAAPSTPGTTTPIHHVVVIFQENVSFDHYFGTYPNATNPVGEPSFSSKARHADR